MKLSKTKNIRLRGDIMKFEKAIEYALDGKALIFCGAGFSRLATNLKGDKMGDAKEFSKNLCSKMGIKENIDLSKVSNYYLKTKSPSELISLLKDEFTCKNLDSGNFGKNNNIYKTIAEVNWMEVYTTNYDNVIEFSFNQLGKKITSVTLSDEPKDYRNQNIVLHINGFINRLTPDKLKSEFKLTTVSYNTEDFIKSKWKGAFTHGLKSAKAVFFIGTSLDYDLDITRIIHSNPEIKDKVFFIDKAVSPDEIDVLDIRDTYGEIKYIGLEGFAEKIIEVSNSYTSKEKEVEFESFQHITASMFEYEEIVNQKYWELLVYGTVDRNITYSNTDNNEYLFDRTIDKQVLDFMNDDNKNVIIIHSDIGNGKSAYLEKLTTKLSGTKNIFKFNKYTKTFDEEIYYIGNNIASPVLIIENYYDHWNVVNSLANYIGPSLKIILSGRSYIHENRVKELLSRLDIERTHIVECNLNKLEDNEIVCLIKLMDKIDIWEGTEYKTLTEKKKHIKYKLNGKLYNVLLEVLQSKSIKDRIDRIYSEIESDDDMKKILVGICINSILDIGMSVYDLVEFLEIPEFDYLLRVNENVRTLINWEENRIEFKSSVLAKYLMKEKMSKVEIFNTIKQIAVYANRNIADDITELISRKLISVSNLQMISGTNRLEYKMKILEIFDDLREYELYRERPYFWLQYAISSLDCKLFDRAEHYLDVALKKCDDIDKSRYRGDSFDTYQLDTQRGRLILERIISMEYSGEISQQLKEVNDLFKKSSQSKLQTDSYIIKQFGLYTKLWDTHGKNMTIEDKQKMLEAVREANKLALRADMKIKELDTLERKIIFSTTNKTS